MMAGSSFVEGATGESVPVPGMELADWLVAQFRRSFARLSICTLWKWMEEEGNLSRDRR